METSLKCLMNCTPETCEDEYDSKINQVRLQMEAEVDRLRLELDSVLEGIEVERVEQGGNSAGI